MNPHPVSPTTCPHCKYSNGGMFSVCPICKREVTHPGDRAVGIATGFACVFIAAFLGGLVT